MFPKSVYNRIMSQNKLYTCIKNIYYIAEIQNKKIGDVEKAANLSAGYLSKLKKEDTSISDFSVLKLDKIASYLNVTIDLLLNENLTTINKNISFIFSFINKMSKKTLDGDLIWEKEDLENISLFFEYKGNINPFLCVENGMSEYYSLIHKTTFAYCGKIYTLDLEKNKKLFLFKVFDILDNFFFELYVYDSNACLLSPISDSNSDETTNLKQAFESLYISAEKSSDSVKLSDEVKEMINFFMESE